MIKKKKKKKKKKAWDLGANHLPYTPAIEISTP